MGGGRGGPGLTQIRRTRCHLSGRCLAVGVGNPSHRYHPQGFYPGARSLGWWVGGSVGAGGWVGLWVRAGGWVGALGAVGAVGAGGRAGRRAGAWVGGSVGAGGWVGGWVRVGGQVGGWVERWV